MTGNVQEAEDAAQETFWRAYQAIQKYDPSRSFITWLLSIAAHYCIDLQRRRILPSLDLDALPEEIIRGNYPEPEKLLLEDMDNQTIKKSLSVLSPLDRAAIIFRYWYDFSDIEIGKALNISVSAVKSRLFRSRQQLAKVIQPDLNMPLLEGGS
jgi:RNA polymerase sigma-70 factor (ECF subfamily)